MLRRAVMEERKWAFKVFSTKGRIGRLKFAYAFILGIIGFAAWSAGMVLCRLTFFTVDVYIGAFALLFYAYTAAVIKRLHDLNRPWTEFFFTLIPIYNIYIFIKLLFFKSKPDAGEPLPRQSRAHYWQVPIIMLLIPALFFGIGLDFQLNKAMVVDPFKTGHWYNEEHKYSLDNVKGLVINVMTEPTDEKPYSEYTKEDFARLSEKFGTVESYVRFEFNPKDDYLSMFTSIFTGYEYRLEDIGGRKFVHITLYYDHPSVLHWVIGVYDGKQYRFLFWNQADDNLLTRYYIDKAMHSIRVGEDAVPKSAD